MTKRSKKHKKDKRRPPSPDSGRRGSSSIGSVGGIMSDRTKAPIVRFVVIFTLLIGAFYAVYLPFSQTESYNSFLNLIARITGTILSVFGEDVTVTANLVKSSRFPMKVVPGCDGMEAMALFVSAVFASPTTLRLRIIFVIPGVLALLLLDFVRLVSLFYIGTYYPDYMHTMHWDIWPGILIAAVLSGWLVWARWIWNQQGQQAHVKP